MSSSENSLNAPLSHKTSLLGLKLWVVVGIAVGISIFSLLALLVLCVFLQSRRKLRKASSTLPINQIPHFSKEINVVGVEVVKDDRYGTLDYMSSDEKIIEKESNKVQAMYTKNNNRQSHCHTYEDVIYQSGDDSENISMHRTSTSHHISTHSPFTCLPELSQLGWGHWFTLRDLQVATDYFSRDRIIGEGGYGIVYYGLLVNGTPVAIKKLLNNLGQAEKEFRVEVDAIGHVRHKHLVRLLGYCVEGTERMLVYEYVNNGNLDQWLHGDIKSHGPLTWEARMKVLLGTAKALAYLHEAIEPKVVHRDIKSSNILIDDEFNAKVSDFGLAKLLGTGKSHITTRVMGTFGYVAPEYASTGLLSEKSDIYSFGVLLLEAITGRDPVDYGRAAHEVNLVDWLKIMISSRRSEEVLDSKLDVRPSTKSLKRALLTVLRCLDPDSNKRPKMSQVVCMLESEVFHSHQQLSSTSRKKKFQDGRNQRKQIGFTEKPNSEKSEDQDSGVYSSKKKATKFKKVTC